MHKVLSVLATQQGGYISVTAVFLSATVGKLCVWDEGGWNAHGSNSLFKEGAPQILTL